MTLLSRKEVREAIQTIVRVAQGKQEPIVRDGDPIIHPTMGLCTNLACYFAGDWGVDEEVELERLFRVWPEFSGNFAYPVNAPGLQYPGAAYNHHQDKFSPRTEYGRARVRLCRFIQKNWGRAL